MAVSDSARGGAGERTNDTVPSGRNKVEVFEDRGRAGGSYAGRKDLDLGDPSWDVARVETYFVNLQEALVRVEEQSLKAWVWRRKCPHLVATGKKGV